MQNKNKAWQACVSAISTFFLSSITTLSFATDGYFTIGHGAYSRGMGGVGFALVQDSISAATNPAGITSLGERGDVSLRLFSPVRSASLDTTPAFGPAPTGFGFPSPPFPPFGFNAEADSDRELFVIPEAGYVMPLNDKASIAFTLIGNGGMNTTYPSNIFDRSFSGGFGTGLPDTGKLGVDLAQGIFYSTAAYRVNNRHSLGASLVLGVQRFSARGLGNFAALGFSSDPANFSSKGNDWSYGAGVRVGWMGEITDQLTLGASYQSKLYMTEFDKYRGLFAEDGDFDIPAVLGAGVAFKATPKLTLALDWERIFYSDVPAIGNSGPSAEEIGAALSGAGVNPDRLLGADNGMGFGWQDINVFKLGASYEYDDHWTFRTGFNYSESPVPDSDLLFNILAPGIVKKHFTLGFTYKLSDSSELSVAYMHAFDEEQSGTTPIDTSAFGGGASRASLQMYQNALEISYSWR